MKNFILICMMFVSTLLSSTISAHDWHSHEYHNHYAEYGVVLVLFIVLVWFFWKKFMQD